MPRNKEFSPKETLQKVMELFWQKGYANTSMDDIVKYTNVSRYGLYGEFGNKQELFSAALDLYSQTIVSKLLKGMESPTASLQSIHTFVQTIINIAKNSNMRWGCFMCNTSIETMYLGKGCSQQTTAHFQRMKQAFYHALKKAKDKKELPESFDITSYAEYLMGATQGLFVLIRSELDMESVERFARTIVKELQ